jgi:glycosyltransferase involved in cell wall biosynthesis
VADARVAVVVPYYEAGDLVLAAVESIREHEPIELVVVDDASPTERAPLKQLESHGVTVIRRARNGGPSHARNEALQATTAPYVLPLDADDLLMPGVLAAMADMLDATPAAAACVGDYEEFGGDRSVTRAIPATLDPFRVAYNNDYPITALYRRSAIRNGWHDPLPDMRGYEDWGLWMTLAERGEPIVHLGAVAYRRRLHAPGVNAAAQRRHAELYRALRAAHPRLFADLPAHRKASTLPPLRRLAYPVLLGDRKLLRGARVVKPLLDRAGFGTRRR